MNATATRLTTVVRLISSCALLIALTGRGPAQESYRSTYRVSMTKIQSSAQRSGEDSLWAYAVSDRNGTVVTTVRRSVPFDVAAPSPVLFESGQMALIFAFDGVMEFYGTGGSFERRVDLVLAKRPEYERTVRSAVHDSKVVLAISEPSAQGIRVLTLTDNGTTIGERTVEGMTATGVAVAPDASTIAVGVSEWEDSTPKVWTRIVQGDRVWSVPFGLQRGTFDESGKCLVGGTSRVVFLADLSTSTVVWSQKADSDRLVIDAVLQGSSVTILTATQPSLVNGSWIYRSPTMRTISENGVVINERSMPSVGFRTGRLTKSPTTVTLDLDGIVYP